MGIGLAGVFEILAFVSGKATPVRAVPQLGRTQVVIPGFFTLDLGLRFAPVLLGISFAWVPAAVNFMRTKLNGAKSRLWVHDATSQKHSTN